MACSIGSLLLNITVTLFWLLDTSCRSARILRHIWYYYIQLFKYICKWMSYILSDYFNASLAKDKYIRYACILLYAPFNEINSFGLDTFRKIWINNLYKRSSVKCGYTKYLKQTPPVWVHTRRSQIKLGKKCSIYYQLQTMSRSWYLSTYPK